MTVSFVYFVTFFAPKTFSPVGVVMVANVSEIFKVLHRW